MLHGGMAGTPPKLPEMGGDIDYPTVEVSAGAPPTDVGGLAPPTLTGGIPGLTPGIGPGGEPQEPRFQSPNRPNVPRMPRRFFRPATVPPSFPFLRPTPPSGVPSGGGPAGGPYDPWERRMYRFGSPRFFQQFRDGGVGGDWRLGGALGSNDPMRTGGGDWRLGGALSGVGRSLAEAGVGMGGRRMTEAGDNPRSFGGTPADFTPPYRWNQGNPTGPETLNPSVEPTPIDINYNPPSNFDPGTYDFGGFDPGVPNFYPTVPYEQSQDVNPNFYAMAHAGQRTEPHARGGVIRYQDGGVAWAEPTPIPGSRDDEYTRYAPYASTVAYGGAVPDEYARYAPYASTVAYGGTPPEVSAEMYRRAMEAMRRPMPGYELPPIIVESRRRWEASRPTTGRQPEIPEYPAQVVYPEPDFADRAASLLGLERKGDEEKNDNYQEGGEVKPTYDSRDFIGGGRYWYHDPRATGVPSPASPVTARDPMNLAMQAAEALPTEAERAAQMNRIVGVTDPLLLNPKTVLQQRDAVQRQLYGMPVNFDVPADYGDITAAGYAEGGVTAEKPWWQTMRQVPWWQTMLAIPLGEREAGRIAAADKTPAFSRERWAAGLENALPIAASQNMGGRFVWLGSDALGQGLTGRPPQAYQEGGVADDDDDYQGGGVTDERKYPMDYRRYRMPVPQTLSERLGVNIYAGLGPLLRSDPMAPFWRHIMDRYAAVPEYPPQTVYPRAQPVLRNPPPEEDVKGQDAVTKLFALGDYARTRGNEEEAMRYYRSADNMRDFGTTADPRDFMPSRDLPAIPPGETPPEAIPPERPLTPAERDRMIINPAEEQPYKPERLQQGGVTKPPKPKPAATDNDSKVPPKKKQPQGRYQFGPEGRYQQPQANSSQGTIPKEFMQYLANGGLIKDFGPDHHLMFALGMKYALSPKQAAKNLAKRTNPMPP